MAAAEAVTTEPGGGMIGDNRRMPRRAVTAAATPPPDRPWFVYLLECRNGRLYAGVTVDLAQRFAQHRSGKGAMFTRLNTPERMLAAQPCASRSEALKLEVRVKRLSPQSKRQLAAQWPLQLPLAVSA
jgi:putative endonuclease